MLAFYGNVLVRAITEQILERLGQLWMANPGLRPFTDKIPVNCDLASHAAIKDSNQIAGVRFYQRPGLFKEKL